METTAKTKRRSQLTVIIIVIVALIGVLVIRTDQATAVKSSAATTEVTTTENQTGTTTGLKTDGFYSSAAPSLFKLISALVIVIACIYAGVYLLRRLMGKKYSGNRQSNLLEVLETTYIGPKKTVSLVRVADRAVLVGTSENHISPLAELDADETARLLAAESTEEETESFKKVFKTAVMKLKEIGLKRADKAALES
ncbi:MAG: flagellar biosynthetic protein FliO [Candidatus Zixiibacteriota bacterium]|nr:MAG: flagellar biosynthetic protein FliO [candidate division Zixibacteria bacterium]